LQDIEREKNIGAPNFLGNFIHSDENLFSEIGRNEQFMGYDGLLENNPHD